MPIGTTNTLIPQPKTNFLSALDQLHKLLTGAGDDENAGGVNPPELLDASPAQASSRILSGKGMLSNAVNSPQLQTAELRTKYRDEAMDHLANALGAGPKYAPDAARASALVKKYDLEESEDPDSYANMQGRQLAAKNADNAADIQEETFNRPGQKAMRDEALRGKIAVARAEHPNMNVSPFADVPPMAGGNPSASTGVAQHGVPAPEGVDPARWAAGTADLAPEAAAKVAAVLRYDLPIPSGNVLARPEWSNIVGRALKVDPSFDYKQYDTRKKYLSDWADSKKLGGAVTGLNTVMKHVNSFDESAKGLHNTGVVPWNWLTNELMGATVGNPAAQRFEADANAVAGELSNVFKATGATDHEIASWRDSLSTSRTQAEYDAKVQELVELIGGRMAALQGGYKRTMGREAPEFLDPESKSIFERFHKPGSQQQQPQAPAAGGVTVRRIG